MKRRVITSALIIMAVMVSVGIVSCSPPPIEIESSGTATLIGVVVDAPKSVTGFETLLDYKEAMTQEQKYAGALIQIHKAVESGTYRIAAGFPERKLYDTGEKVAEMKAGSDGQFQVELPTGAYFIRAFYGQSSHSGDRFIELKKGETKHIGIGLIHGI